MLLAALSLAMGGVYVKRNVAIQIAEREIEQIAPVILGNNGSVRFPERIPSPETVYQIQMAVQTDDAQKLNSLLIEHRFYVLPGQITKR